MQQKSSNELLAVHYFVSYCFCVFDMSYVIRTSNGFACLLLGGCGSRDTHTQPRELSSFEGIHYERKERMDRSIHPFLPPAWACVVCFVLFCVALRLFALCAGLIDSVRFGSIRWRSKRSTPFESNQIESSSSGSEKLSWFVLFRFLFFRFVYYCILSHIHLDEPKARGGRIPWGGLVGSANASADVAARSSLKGGRDRRKQARLLRLRLRLLLLLELKAHRSLVRTTTTTTTTSTWKGLREEGFRGPEHLELAGQEPSGHQNDPKKQQNRQQRDVAEHRQCTATAAAASEPRGG